MFIITIKALRRANTHVARWSVMYSFSTKHIICKQDPISKENLQKVIRSVKLQSIP